MDFWIEVLLYTFVSYHPIDLKSQESQYYHVKPPGYVRLSSNSQRYIRMYTDNNIYIVDR